MRVKIGLMVTILISSVGLGAPELPFTSLGCEYSDVLLNLAFESSSAMGNADFSAIRRVKVGHHYVPLPEPLFGPITVHWRVEGTHYLVEGTGFQFLLKESPFGGYVGLLQQAPQALSRLKVSPRDYFSCTGYSGTWLGKE